jgi:hypothetical protein
METTMVSRFLRLMIVLIAAASLSMAAILPAGAVVHDFVPVSFTLTPDICPDVETTITGGGEYFFRIHEREMRDGSLQVIVNVTIHGTATNTEGNGYVFNYHNTFHGIAPADADQFTMLGTDHFNLVGAGGENTVHVGFVTVLTFEDLAAGPIAFDDITVRGELSCDQI